MKQQVYLPFSKYYQDDQEKIDPVKYEKQQSGLSWTKGSGQSHSHKTTTQTVEAQDGDLKPADQNPF